MVQKAAEQQQWEQLNMWIELIPNYPRFNLDTRPMNFEFLDHILATLLYVNAVSFFDNMLERYISARGVTCPKNKYHPNLGGRLRCLKDNGKLCDFAELERIRKRRNDFGHRLDEFATWDELRSDVAKMGLELQHLGVVQSAPEYSFIAERSIGEISTDPNVLFEFQHFVGLNYKDTGNQALRYSWKSQIYNDASTS
jgi:hypothetical protein